MFSLVATTVVATSAVAARSFIPAGDMAPMIARIANDGAYPADEARKREWLAANGYAEPLKGKVKPAVTVLKCPKQLEGAQ